MDSSAGVENCEVLNRKKLENIDLIIDYIELLLGKTYSQQNIKKFMRNYLHSLFDHSKLFIKNYSSGFRNSYILLRKNTTYKEERKMSIT